MPFYIYLYTLYESVTFISKVWKDFVGTGKLSDYSVIVLVRLVVRRLDIPPISENHWQPTSPN